MRNITKEKGILETKRLDLDTCKSKVRKARSMIGNQAVGKSFSLYLIENYKLQMFLIMLPDGNYLLNSEEGWS